MSRKSEKIFATHPENVFLLAFPRAAEHKTFAFVARRFCCCEKFIAIKLKEIKAS